MEWWLCLRGGEEGTYSHCSETVEDDGAANLRTACIDGAISSRTGDSSVEGAACGIEDCAVDLCAWGVGGESEGRGGSKGSQVEEGEELHCTGVFRLQ